MVNLTCTNRDYWRAWRRLRLMDRQQGLCILLATGCALLGMLFAFLDLWYVTMALEAAAIVTIWLRPLLSLLRRSGGEREQQLVFTDAGITCTVDAAERRYYWINLKRALVRGNWILLEFRKGWLLLDGRGFEDCLREDFLGMLRTRRPPVRIRRSGEGAVLLLLLPLLAVTLLCALVTELSAAGSIRRQQRAALEAAMATAATTEPAAPPTEEPSETEPVEVDFKPLKTRELDMLSIDLPGNFGPYSDYMYVSRKYMILIGAQCWAKISFNASSVVEFAVEYSKDAGGDGVTINALGNPSCTYQIGDSEDVGYSVFFENDHYYIALQFVCDAEEYDLYLPYFQQWEATVKLREAVDPPSLESTRKWENDVLSAYIPEDAEDYSYANDHLVVYMSSPVGINFGVQKFEADAETEQLPDKDYWILCFAESNMTVTPEELRDSGTGYLIYEDDYNGTHYLHALIRCESGNYAVTYIWYTPAVGELFGDILRSWIEQIEVK